MIINIGENYRASVKQNSSGFWYCNELTVSDNSLTDLMQVKLDKGIYLMEELLDKYNKPVEPKKN